MHQSKSDRIFSASKGSGMTTLSAARHSGANQYGAGLHIPKGHVWLHLLTNKSASVGSELSFQQLCRQIH
jgi:hypothetical protein